MAEVKTQPTEISVTSFIETIADYQVRADCYTLINLMEKASGEQPKMWGPAIIGFGKYAYKYESGHSGEMCITGFSPRKANLTLYILAGFPGQVELLEQLGKHKTGKGCLYIKKLTDINIAVLENVIKEATSFLKEKYSN